MEVASHSYNLDAPGFAYNALTICPAFNDVPGPQIHARGDKDQN